MWLRKDSPFFRSAVLSFMEISQPICFHPVCTGQNGLCSDIKYQRLAVGWHGMLSRHLSMPFQDRACQPVGHGGKAEDHQTQQYDSALLANNQKPLNL